MGICNKEVDEIINGIKRAEMETFEKRTDLELIVESICNTFGFDDGCSLCPFNNEELLPCDFNFKPCEDKIKQVDWERIDKLANKWIAEHKDEWIKSIKERNA